MPEPGWYDDPLGEAAQRWWDGTAWTEQTSDAPTIIANLPQSPAVEPGMPAQPGVGAGVGAGFEPAVGAIRPPLDQPAPAPSGRRTWLFVALAVLGVVVIGVVLVVVLPLGGSVRAGTEVTFEVPPNGFWEYEFTAPQGRLVIDVRGDRGFDPVAFLEDAETGRLLLENDDRTSDQLSEFGGGRFDSLLDSWVPAGTYRLIVEEYAGEGGSGTVSFPIAGE